MFKQMHIGSSKATMHKTTCCMHYVHNIIVLCVLDCCQLQTNCNKSLRNRKHIYLSQHVSAYRRTAVYSPIMIVMSTVLYARRCLVCGVTYDTLEW